MENCRAADETSTIASAVSEAEEAWAALVREERGAMSARSKVWGLAIADKQSDWSEKDGEEDGGKEDKRRCGQIYVLPVEEKRKKRSERHHVRCAVHWYTQCDECVECDDDAQ